MSPEELQTIATVLAAKISPNPVVTWIGAALAAGGAAYFGAYFHEKGRSAATKEDIHHITTKIESIKKSFALEIEERKHQNSLQHAALEKRLEVHQQAFSLWWELFFSVYSDEVVENVQKCEKFWVENNLYLSESARHAFRAAYSSAKEHSQLVDNLRGKGPESTADVQANFQRIKRAGDEITKSVALPPLDLLPSELPAINKGYN